MLIKTDILPLDDDGDDSDYSSPLGGMSSLPEARQDSRDRQVNLTSRARYIYDWARGNPGAPERGFPYKVSVPGPRDLCPGPQMRFVSGPSS